MSVIIGIDPHKLLHAACVIDRREVEFAELAGAHRAASMVELLAWAAPFECRSWAIESAGGLGYLLAQQLVAHGEHVVDVPATLSSRVRAVGLGPVDQERRQRRPRRRDRSAALTVVGGWCAARITSACCACWPKLSSTRHGPGAGRVAGCMRWCASWCAGGIRKEIVVDTSRSGPRRRSSPLTATQRQRLELAHETLDEIRMLDAKLKRSKTRITDAVTASAARR